MNWLKKRRRTRLANRSFPDTWEHVLRTSVPLYNRLSDPDRRELQRHIQIFLAEKRFEGCQGLEITDQVRLTIAAQACMLLLHRETDYFPGLTSILVHPGTYVVDDVLRVAGGMVLESREVREGESWHRGAVVLSWDDVRRGTENPDDGHNVVLHEFAHQLDTMWGKGDSSPVLRDRASFRAWTEALERNFKRFRRDIRYDRARVLDDYGATDPAEFFAVATECFFEVPRDLRSAYPDLYEELKRFYQQDPALWEPGRE
jgi:Mlc titration factor MtfA (ptsG expression regulator)